MPKENCNDKLDNSAVAILAIKQNSNSVIMAQDL